MHRLKTVSPSPARPAGRRWTALVLACALLSAPLGSGCYGKFPLTRNIYHLNGSAGPIDALHTVVMWLFTPLYIVAIPVDAVIFNFVEYWTGLTLPVLAEADEAEGRAGQQWAQPSDNTVPLQLVMDTPREP